jgi:hypothetical protein
MGSKYPQKNWLKDTSRTLKYALVWLKSIKKIDFFTTPFCVMLFAMPLWKKGLKRAPL